MSRRDQTPRGRQAGLRSGTEVPAENPAFGRSETFIDYIHASGRHYVKTSRRCTDLFCLFFFISFCCILSASYQWSQKDGHLERITHGIDYRGRLCGMEDQKERSYLLWCTPEGRSISWVDPVCVKQCPIEGNLPSVMCPLPKVKNEVELPGQNGTIRIVQTVEQELVPSKTFPTKTYLYYCLPEVESQVVTTLLQHAVGEGTGAGKQLTQVHFVYSKLHELWSRWRLILLAAIFAVSFAYLYLVLLRYFARPFVYGSFSVILVSSMVFSYLCFCKSYAVMVEAILYTRSFYLVAWIEGNILAPLSFVSFQWTHYFTDYAEGVMPDFRVVSDKIDEVYLNYDVGNTTRPIIESIQHEIAGANARFVEAASPLLSKVENFRVFSIEGMFRPAFGGFTEYALFAVGLGCLLLALSIGSILLYSRKSLRTAIQCVEQACEVLFDIKMLLLIPFFQFVAWCALVVAFAFPMMQVISTVPVEPMMFSVSGIEIFGVGRTLNPGLLHLGHLLLWFFGLLWIQELISTLCHFVASYTAVEWFASPWDGERKKARPFLVFRGFVIGVTFHLGSLALIAFSSAVVRFTRWIYYMVIKNKNENRSRFFRCFAQAVDCVLAFIESFIQYLSTHILTEIAMCGSNSFIASAQNVTKVLSSYPMYAAILHGTEWLFTIVGALSVSFATMAAMIVAIENPKVVNIEMLRDLEGADENLFAAVGAILGLFVGYTFMTLMDRIAETVLYCYLSQKANDTSENASGLTQSMDAEELPKAPQTLVRFLTTHELESNIHMPSSTRFADMEAKVLLPKEDNYGDYEDEMTTNENN